MPANGKVCTGFSKPFVAKYSATGGQITYSNGMPLARGVSVSLSPNTSDDNIFYADNIEAENASGSITGGTVTLVVDGLLEAAETLIMGLGAADEQGFINYDDTQKIPYLGIGFIARYKSDGVDSFVPCILPKTMFQQLTGSFKTQESSIDWQTQELTAKFLRDDSTTKRWKRVGEECTTEAEAEEKIKAVFNIAD